MAEYKLSNKAELDLDNIYLYSLAQFGETKAEAYLLTLHKCFMSIANNPMLGMDVSYVRSNYRRYHHLHHFIYYLAIHQGIFIVRLLHERMKPELHF